MRDFIFGAPDFLTLRSFAIRVLNAGSVIRFSIYLLVWLSVCVCISLWISV